MYSCLTLTPILKPRAVPLTKQRWSSLRLVLETSVIHLADSFPRFVESYYNFVSFFFNNNCNQIGIFSNYVLKIGHSLFVPDRKINFIYAVAVVCWLVPSNIFEDTFTTLRQWPSNYTLSSTKQKLKNIDWQLRKKRNKKKNKWKEPEVKSSQ